MKNRLFQISLLVIILGAIWISSCREVRGLTYSSTSNYGGTYTFDVYSGYRRFSHKLYIYVPPSLYDYYRSGTHRISSEYDYAKYVTPGTFKSLAENIRNVTRKISCSDEQFADAVLMLVHQIQYLKSNVKYPAEALIDNSGDCEALSLLAASIMKSGGLDVVIFYYKDLNPSHMNVGVYLPYTPAYHTLSGAPTYHEYNGKKYWMAECTPLADWKVGDQPSGVVHATPRIISLENCEKSSPAQVSSSLDTPLLSSSITASPSQAPSNIEVSARALTISGSISPTYSEKDVAVYVSCNGSSYYYFRTVTDSVGTYVVTWNFTSPGTYYIRTSWSGASKYAGADSETLIVFVGPESLIQFEGPYYNYMFGQAATASYALRPMEGVDHFLSISLETGISFSYDFMILQAGYTASNVQTETMTIPGSEQTIRVGRSRQTITIQIPEKKITVPINVPTGMVPLRLPDDVNQTINSQFCFILQNDSGNNCSLNVRGLDDYDMSDIIRGNESNSVFMNATENVKENIWYKVTASIFEKGMTANLSNKYGTLIESVITPYDAMNSNEMVMLITNNVDKAIVFKDLKIETLKITTQPPESNKKATNYGGLPVPYVSLSIFLVVAFAVVIVYVKKKRQMIDQK